MRNDTNSRSKIGDARTVHGAWIDRVVAVARGLHAPESDQITMCEDACTFGHRPHQRRRERCGIIRVHMQG